MTDTDQERDGDTGVKSEADGASEADSTNDVEATRTADVTSEVSATNDDGDEPMAADDPALVVEDVTRRFGDLTVLSGVSLAVDRGEVACVVGPNGAGKTTLLRIVAGLLAPSTGRVARAGDETDGRRVARAGDETDGRRVARAGDETDGRRVAHAGDGADGRRVAHAGDGADGEPAGVAGRQVGYLPQTPAYRPQFSLAETLAFYASLADVDLDPDAVLDQVGLAAVADRRVGALSGGMTRLFGIAIATVGDPPLLVLDEPSSGLDPVMADQVAGVVTDLAAGDATVLLATHDLATVDRVADTVFVLDRGTVAASGPPEDLRARTGTETLSRAITEIVVADAGGLTVRAGDREGSS